MIDDENENEKKKTVFSFRSSKKIKGIAMLAVESGAIVNIADVYTDPRFDRSVDQKSGFLTRSVLCMPIKDNLGCTGVIQIINKLPAGQFNLTDEHMFAVFGTYCANIVNYKKQYDARKRSESMTAVYNDIMTNRVKFKLIVNPLTIPSRNSMPPAPADFLRYEQRGGGWFIPPPGFSTTSTMF